MSRSVVMQAMNKLNELLQSEEPTKRNAKSVTRRVSPMGGARGKPTNIYGGTRTRTRARAPAAPNSWIMFLKHMEQQTGIPYNELISDPRVQDEYQMLKASGQIPGAGMVAGRARRAPRPMRAMY